MKHFIDDYIKQAKQLATHHREGNSKKVYIFEDVVLLSAKFNEASLLDEMKTIANAKACGIKTPAILGYRIVGTPDKNGLCSGYILQEKAKGQELLDIGGFSGIPDKQKVFDEMVTLANTPQEHFDKFMSDWVNLEKTYGANLDLRRTNYFYCKEKGFSFVDLVFDNNQPVRDTFRVNPIRLLAPYAYECSENKEQQKMTARIILKTLNALQKQGLTNKEIATGLLFLANINDKRSGANRDVDKYVFACLAQNPRICKRHPSIDFNDIFRLREDMGFKVETKKSILKRLRIPKIRLARNSFGQNKKR